MTKRVINTVWCLAFALVGLLGMGLGRLSQEPSLSLDFWCDGESALAAQAKGQPMWLTTRFSLDLNSNELSHMRLAARLVNAESGAEVGMMHRYSAFHAKLEGHLLLVELDNNLKSETDNLTPDLLISLGLFIFHDKGSLSYWMQPLGKTRYLFDDGEGMFILCKKRSTPPAVHRL